MQLIAILERVAERHNRPIESRTVRLVLIISKNRRTVRVDAIAISTTAKFRLQLGIRGYLLESRSIPYLDLGYTLLTLLGRNDHGAVGGFGTIESHRTGAI